MGTRHLALDDRIPEQPVPQAAQASGQLLVAKPPGRKKAKRRICHQVAIGVVEMHPIRLTADTDQAAVIWPHQISGTGHHLHTGLFLHMGHGRKMPRLKPVVGVQQGNGIKLLGCRRRAPDSARGITRIPVPHGQGNVLAIPALDLRPCKPVGHHDVRHLRMGLLANTVMTTLQFGKRLLVIRGDNGDAQNKPFAVNCSVNLKNSVNNSIYFAGA